MLLARIAIKKRAGGFFVVVVICDFSNKAKISCGVVQGSILAHLLLSLIHGIRQCLI